ncbi:MAG TPA: hypothetical protein VHC39_09395 [Rhizomicrobium sp.]|nr:hypothetical protein [Rhizomicrobium sp.]
MPRYFFHIVDDETRSLDEEGLEFPDLMAATKEAEASAHELMVQDLKAGRELDDRRIEITDAAGTVVGVCRLRDLAN